MQKEGGKISEMTPSGKQRFRVESHNPGFKPNEASIDFTHFVANIPFKKTPYPCHVRPRFLIFNDKRASIFYKMILKIV